VIRILFHHRGRAVDVVEILGVIALGAAAWRMASAETSAAAWIAFALVVVEYAFIRYCATVRWYEDAERYEGIELQFKKGMVPTAYVLFLGGLLFQLISSLPVLLVMVAMLAVVGHVNIILLHLRSKDRDGMPVNFFSGNKGP
jgi:hypothetical protein